MPLNKRKEKKSNHNTENIISESFFSIFVFFGGRRGGIINFHPHFYILTSREIRFRKRKKKRKKKKNQQTFI